MALIDDGFVEIGSSRLEYKMVGPHPGEAATFVLLHEGLGSVGIWGDFPARLADTTGFGVFAYSRAGYGRSTPATMPRRVTFMHEEARDVMPRVCDAIGFQRGVLLPQVATEQGWDSRRFLEETCVKAGLHRAAWNHPETQILAFTALVFSESEILPTVRLQGPTS